MPSNDLTTQLLPLLSRDMQPGFNVFDVMHHGTHEKQLSNVFAWILNIGGTHNFGDLGQRVFLGLVNELSSLKLPLEGYAVRQEVNTSAPGETLDIADIVLESADAGIVIENYGYSDGHGHSYKQYLALARRGGRPGLVVMLCAVEDRGRLDAEWARSTVVTYEALLDLMLLELSSDTRYRRGNPEAFDFITQLHRKYANGKNRMSTNTVLEFVSAMCTTGEAGRYQAQNQEVAAAQFANDLAQQSRQRFAEGREALQTVKARLRGFADKTLRQQLQQLDGEVQLATVSSGYAGIYQWTVNLDTAVGTRLQLKFGPSAWHAINADKDWKKRVEHEVADYSRLFVTNTDTLEIRQSRVALTEVLEGIPAFDSRLRDELLAL